MRQERDSQLRQIGDNLPEGALYQLIAASKDDRKFVYWSAGIERLIGVSAEEALADVNILYSLISPEHLTAVLAAEEHSFKERCIFNVVVQMKHAKTGEWRWVHLRSAPRILASGGTIWDGIYLDVTRQKAVEQDLARSQERLELAQRAGNIGVFDWDIQTNNIVWSEEEKRIFGVIDQPFSGKIEEWWQRVIPEDLDRMNAEMQAVMSRKEHDMTFLFRIIRPDGQLRWIEGAGRFLYDEHGSPQRMVGVNLDVTAAKEAERQMIEADHRKNEFLAMLAHELRNPLSAIRNALELVDSELSDVEIHKWATGVLDRQSKQLVRLVDDLLDVSRITRDKIELRKETVEVAAILDQAIETIRPLISQRKIALIASYASDGTMTVEADPARLQQIVVNLLNNAAKFTEQQGHIWLTAQRISENVAITVRDDGIGIAPENVEQMFELFTQGERSLARTEGGLGLGLTIARKLARMHKGDIVAESEGFGKGASFTVTIPIKKPKVTKTEMPLVNKSERGGYLLSMITWILPKDLLVS